jgi:tetratricopeptide (TPR) repeat protein
VQVRILFEEVDRLLGEQKWPEALAALMRSEATLTASAAGGALRQRLEEAIHDLMFVCELDSIRQDSALSIEGSDFDTRGAAQRYPRAFRFFGVDVEQLPTETAVAALRERPALAVPIAAALDGWVDVRRALGEGESKWKPLVEVARGLDPDPLRDRLRALWGLPLTLELRVELGRLAASIEGKAHSPTALVALANALAEAGMPDSALQVLRDGQHSYPGDFWLAFDLGRAFFSRKDYAEAVRFYSVAVSIRPDSTAAHGNLGNALRRQGKLDEAIAELRKAIELDPKSARAYNGLGTALKDRGKLDQAVVEYRRALELDPEGAEYHSNFGVALIRQGKVNEAAAELRKAIDLDPNYALAHSNLGSALGDQGRLDEAITEYRKAIDLDPNLAEAHNGLGNVLMARGKLDEAIAEHKTAIDLDPRDALAHYNLGIAWQSQGRLDEAVAEYRKGLSLNPTSAKAHNNLGIALKDRWELDQAIAEHREALRLQPDYAEAHCNLGFLLLRKCELRQALQELRRGHELGSHSPRWRYPSADYVRQCERLIELDGLLPSFLDGTRTPANPTERIELAELCVLKRLYRVAVRLYEEAFAADARLADDLRDTNRYNAACAAALAGCGRGEEAEKLDDRDRAHLRCQALSWLRADLTVWGRVLARSAGRSPQVAGALRNWLAGPDLIVLRGPDTLAVLPEAERQAWQKLWNDVSDLLRRAQRKAGPEKKAAAP